MPTKITAPACIAVIGGALGLIDISPSANAHRWVHNTRVIAAQAATHVNRTQTDSGLRIDPSSVIPAQAGIQRGRPWVPAFAGMTKGGAPQDTGAKLFALTCVTCHKANGLGIPDSVPPLAGSEWATGSPARMLRIVMGGMQGEIEVLGEFFNAAMPGWGATLNDFDIAAVTTYVRKSWGNKGSAITAENVAQIRKATVDRKTPWTAEELRKIGG